MVNIPWQVSQRSESLRPHFYLYVSRVSIDEAKKIWQTEWPTGYSILSFSLPLPFRKRNTKRNTISFFYLFSCPYYSGKETLFLLRHFVWWWIANDARLCVGAVNIGKNGDIWLAITDLTLTGIPELGGHVTLGLKTNLRPRVSQIERFGFQKVKQWPAASDLWNVTCVLDPPGTVPKNKKTNLHNPYSARALREIIIWLAPWAGKMNQIARYDWLLERARWSHLAGSEFLAWSRKIKAHFLCVWTMIS